MFPPKAEVIELDVSASAATGKEEKSMIEIMLKFEGVVVQFRMLKFCCFDEFYLLVFMLYFNCKL